MSGGAPMTMKAGTQIALKERISADFFDFIFSICENRFFLRYQRSIYKAGQQLVK